MIVSVEKRTVYIPQAVLPNHYYHYLFGGQLMIADRAAEGSVESLVISVMISRCADAS